MRHVFILNPAAGKKQAARALAPMIETACRDAGCDFSLRYTQAPDDATRMAREEAARGDAVRLYACGGDGTLLEVLSGLTPGSTVEVAHIPCGSGNDFVRNFGSSAPFLSIPTMLTAPAAPTDGICCEMAGQPPRYALNVAATGMDAAVAHHMKEFRRWPLVSGSMAYDLALAKVFFSKLGCSLTVEMETTEGPVRLSGQYLFALCANGQYYGGGFHAAPTALPHDGLLDFVLVETMSRPRMLSLIPKYKAGTHLGLSGIHHWRGMSMTVKIDQPTPVTLDGECRLTDEFRVSVCPAAYRFVLPEGVATPAMAAAR